MAVKKAYEIILCYKGMSSMMCTLAEEMPAAKKGEKFALSRTTHAQVLIMFL